ncbi:hypothetical protein CKA32_004691 [Geitlerinema sp. FC II]|uniref:hypothetical protein n=1 Tax=Baaleninema simplex TaxID=2862350 RepID=UPI00034502FE|nr:hypothetical protein [Baaleninema simplex]MDC0832347.1 hypothetical protein [Geitlerinema sp. CS-897]PPT05127.1 hypothetical protein CKA32_004691 [Geitlerinema sp. FC II]
MSYVQAQTCDRTVREIADRIFESHRITRADQQVFMASLLSKSSLTLEEQNLINHVFEELKRGVLRVVD